MTILFSASFAFSGSNVSPLVSGTSEQVTVSNELEIVTAVHNAVEPIIIMLSQDISLTEPLDIMAGKDITLTSTGKVGFYKLIGTKYVEEGSYATIIVQKCGVLRLNGVIVTHETGILGSGVNVYPDGTLIMINGEISGNNGFVGGGVYNCGTFKMYGGKISDNSAQSGGGVYTFCHSDPRVYEMGVFELYGGEIFGNIASAHGGGVYSLRGMFSLFDGVISNNQAGFEGGGVYSYEGNFTMSGGTISGNTALSGGGGVSFRGTNFLGCSFELSGGTISGNTATGVGGGVSNIQSTFIMSGGKISKNTVLCKNNSKDSASYGGGVCNYLGTFKLSGGAISSNTASKGGDIYNSDSDVYYFGINDNTLTCMSVVLFLIGVFVFVLFFYLKKHKGGLLKRFP